MTNNKKPLLWEEGMTYEDFKTRQAFYNGTAQPKHSPLSQPPEDQEILDIMSYESFEDYDADSKMLHAAHAAWNAMAYLEFLLTEGKALKSE